MARYFSIDYLQSCNVCGPNSSSFEIMRCLFMSTSYAILNLHGLVPYSRSGKPQGAGVSFLDGDILRAAINLNLIWIESNEDPS